MHHLLLKRCGILFITVGLIITAVCLYMSYLFSITIITELPAAVITIYLGVHLIKIGNEQTPKMEESFSSKNGRTSPFYFELDPTLVNPRALPPVPKDIGREYDPIVLDKV
ncbi:hypothetical protein HNY73_000438 [Argiope bruennichi]|uniref:Uncharacterized protein n=1 Tax=Argiope bruennichi TaxID=94029 RepID=A0A8T0FZA0_ARGBR|nr:hypothetical protein HNY73_000438 [Argiope bruennichi]